VTGLVNQELLLQNEYLAAEHKILRAQLPARLRLSDPERSTLAEIGKRLGRKALAQVACVAWREFIASHMAVLAAIDFFTVEVLIWRGLVTFGGVMHCMTGTRSSVRHFGRRSLRAVSTRSNCPHGVQI
jgi:hypothetical protein